jgi:hypothetical protein
MFYAKLKYMQLHNCMDSFGYYHSAYAEKLSMQNLFEQSLIMSDGLAFMSETKFMKRLKGVE